MVVNPDLLPAFFKTIPLFGHLDDQDLALLASHMQSRVVEKDGKIYPLGGDALHFNILYKGKVCLKREVVEEDVYDAVIAPGDFFGLESISGEPYWVTDAIAEEDSIVLYINSAELDDLSRDIPDLRYRLDLAVRSFILMWNVSLTWREPDEAIYYFARRHIIYMMIRMIGPFIFLLIALTSFLAGELMMQGAMVLPLVLAGGLVTAALLWGVWIYFDWANDYFVVTDRRVLVFEKVILMFDSRVETPLEAVLAVNQRTSWLGRILNFGDLSVKSFTGTIGMTYLEATSEVQRIIEYLLLRARQRKSSEEIRTIGQTIRQRLSKQRQASVAQRPSQQTEQERDAPPVVRMSPLHRQIATFLNLRIEENGVIIYRKHWFILLQQVWVPTLILLFLLVVFLMRLFGLFAIFSTAATAVVIIPIGVIVFLWWGYQYWDWTNDVYIITSEQLIDVDKRPLGTETRKAAPLKNILSIEYQRLGIIGNIFNFGTVFIKVGETTFTFDYVHDPRRVQRELFNRFSEVKERERKAEEQADHKRMADWIETYHRWQEDEGHASAE